MTQHVIIDVVCLASAHPLDADVVGTYGVALGDGVGDYSPVPRGEVMAGQDPLHEAALDVFHDHVPIRQLDCFDFTLRTLAPGEPLPPDVQIL